ncbi:MAG: TSUP family transporter [Candidatus Sericytochromatia bacterium]
MLILSLLALIQSLFGVGILLFGTPLLLALGHPYPEALAILLPTSAALSWSQVWDQRHIALSGGYRRRFLLYCLPALGLGTLLATHWLPLVAIKTGVCAILLLTLGMRLHPTGPEWLRKRLSQHMRPALALVGGVHGLSNMGGSLLAPLVSGLYPDKESILAGISLDYATMASFQLGMLALLQAGLLQPRHLLGSAIALGVRYSLGRRLYRFTSERVYQHLISVLIAANLALLASTLWRS